ncbi:hypothetical protein M9H77_22735 [Catharanthus roseus]|uniref:Uncharacterized protein n=1 Tax=Catharanthus roseus TaxID=4058 RepID=A0ACC0ASJ0_CATRO|nr:hypothetical protein M9H77_22735 [Catharanthus roseus]
MPSTWSGAASSSSSAGGGSFEAYFQRWIARQEQFLYELVAARDSSSGSENNLRDLIARVRAHYLEYYEEKSRMTNGNVFLMFSPNWFTPLERSFLWIAGFKPGLACRLVISAVDDLTDEQKERVRQLSHDTKRQEKLLNDEIAKIQESLAAPPLIDSARILGRQPQPFQREIEEADTVIEPLKYAMQDVLNDADRLRTRTAEKVVDILNPIQSVRFFAAAADLQMRLRTIGLQKEADRANVTATNGW